VGYTKLFNEILYSTIWQESDHTRLVWITMLALKDERHQVMASVPGLAKAANVTREQCEEALQKFLSPDPDSRSQDFEGRRIEKVDGGWWILSGEKFQKRQSIEEKKEHNAEYMRKYRKLKQNNNTVSDNVIGVMKCNESKESGLPEQNITDHNRTEKNPISISSEDEAPREEIFSKSFRLFWEQYPKKTGRLAVWKSWKRMRLDSKIDTILSALELQKRSTKWTEEGGRFIPNPLTWLNQGRWDDEVRVEKTQKEKIKEALLS